MLAHAISITRATTAIRISSGRSNRRTNPNSELPVATGTAVSVRIAKLRCAAAGQSSGTAAARIPDERVFSPAIIRAWLSPGLARPATCNHEREWTRESSRESSPSKIRAAQIGRATSNLSPWSML